jgi:hypothetical protein
LRRELEPLWVGRTDPPRLLLYASMAQAQAENALIEFEVAVAVRLLSRLSHEAWFGSRTTYRWGVWQPLRTARGAADGHFGEGKRARGRVTRAGRASTHSDCAARQRVRLMILATHSRGKRLWLEVRSDGSQSTGM